ncbi:FHA domain-containing protein [Anatilimnocola aggregata]|nr:FHA domain-containing protein [Anatilimnocola aggregata]
MTPPRTFKTGLLGSATGDLVLQICGGEHDGRTLRIAAAKCVIGSATGCTLRLRARGVRPIHCLILRGPRGAVVRCWTADVLLNERGFSESALGVGDSLQLGPVKLSVVDLGRPAPADEAPAEEEAECSTVNQTPEAQPPQRPSPRVRNRRKQLFDVLRQDRKQQAELQATIQSQSEQLKAMQQQVEQVTVAATNVERTSTAAIDDCVQQQLAKTVEQLRQELEAAAQRRALEQQSVSRQRANWEEQAEQRRTAELQQLRDELQQEQALQSSKMAAELKAKHDGEIAQLRDAAIRAAASTKAELTAIADERETLAREVAALKLALETKEHSEEFSRQSIASQIEQLSHAFELVRQERDELFQRLQDEQLNFDQQLARAQSQADEARLSALRQLREVQSNADTKAAQLEQELTALRSQTAGASTSLQQERDGWTQARKSLEAELVALNGRLRQSEELLHEARENSGQLQAAVLAEAESARKERDAVRAQMLRQQQDWTEFRTRLEAAGVEERQLAEERCAGLQAELATQRQAYELARSESRQLQDQLTQLQIELEQSQEALFAAEHGVNNRLQQMTVSMEQLQIDRGGVESQLEIERAEWEQERNALALCVAELQTEVTRLTTEQAAAEEAARQQLTSEAERRVDTAQQALIAAQQQLEHWQEAATTNKLQCEELLAAAAKFQRQELAWQLEREQLEILQQSSNERLQHLETAINDLQQQLADAHAAVAVTCAPSSFAAPPAEENLGRTINVNNQDLAALQEQSMLAAVVPGGLLAPHDVSHVPDSAELQARAATLQEQAEELAAQQSQLEEQQAIVARQRIELEQFQASLVELEQTLLHREQELQQLASMPANAAAVPAADHYYEHSYGGAEEAERESNPLSESEAFAAMADQVAALYREPQEVVNEQVSLADANVHDSLYDSPATFSNPEEPLSNAEEPDAEESLIIPTTSPADAEVADAVSNEFIIQPSADDVVEATPPLFNAEESSAGDDFESQLEARMARVMRQEKSSWNAASSTGNEGSDNLAPAEPEAPPTQSQAVNSVLDRLREAGLWKGEGTAKSDQLPSSHPPVDEGLCRQSSVGAIVGDLPTAADVEEQVEEEPEDNLALLARSAPAKASLLESPTSEQSEADDSIESYMSRLMQRLRKSDEVEEPVKKNTGNNHSRVSTPVAAPVVPVAPVKQTDSTPLTSLSDLAPRSQAPELGANLAAMRELANSAARGAIETHKQQSSAQRVTKRTVFSLMALLVASGFVLCYVRTNSSIALGGVALSILWAVSSSALAGYQNMTLRRASQDSNDVPPDAAK